MRIIIIIAALTLLAFSFACKDNPAQGNNERGLEGNWLLIKSIGGISGGTIYPPANTRYLLNITTDNYFIESRNDTITFSDKFVTYMDTIYQRQVIDFITSEKLSIFIRQVSADSLILQDTFVDGYSYFYIRKH